MVKGIVVNDNDISSQVGFIFANTREELTDIINKKTLKFCLGGHYEVLKDDEYKYSIRFIDKRCHNVVTTTVHFNVMESIFG